MKQRSQQFEFLDIGCGNGRDSYYLSKQHNVIGIDINNLPKNKNNCKFILDNMLNINKFDYNIIYSRFSLHIV